MRSATAASSTAPAQEPDIVESGSDDTDIIALSEDEARQGRKRVYNLSTVWVHFERIAKSNVKSRVADARCKADNCNWLKKSAKINDLHNHALYSEIK